MFGETGVFGGREQRRFAPHDAALVPLADLPTARALVAHLRGRARRERGLDLDAALRVPPPEPTGCCGRGCNGCVWEGFYEALDRWRTDALGLLEG
ncbi:MAG: oxidoreductase [Burkholderiales bacterium]|nr:MAG: oxidoreductase [Burkholderiales bacterium]